MICTIREFEGRVYAVHTTCSYSEPTETELWWLLATDPGVFRDGVCATWDTTLQVFHVESDRPGESTRPIAPADRRQNAQADRVVHRQIPSPRTRLETRWRYGRWERLTARGWR